MAIPNTETLLPTLLSRYVHSRRADLSLPSESALPFVTYPTIDEQKYPRVMFVTTAVSVPHRLRLTMTITVELQTNAELQPTPEENIWVAGLRYALADKVAFFAWLADLSEAERTGYDVKRYRFMDLGMAVDEEKKIRGRRTDVMMHVRTDELAPPQP